MRMWRGSPRTRSADSWNRCGGRVVSLIVRKIESRIVDHPVRQDGAILSSLGRHEASRYVTVTITGDDGTRGFGEATTAPVWSGETAETAKWLLDHHLGPRLIGRTFGHPAEALELMDRNLHGNPFTKAAVDIALWDLWARSQGVSVASLIADRAPVEWI